MPFIKYTVLLVLIASIVQAGSLGIVFIIRKKPNRLANLFFGLLLLAFTSSSIAILLLRSHSLMPDFQHLYHLPLWLTLFFGPFLFYHVKFSLFPNYKLRATDAKHFILGLIQVSFLIYMSMQPLVRQNEIYQSIVMPYYGPMEYTAFLLTLFIYLSISYRYIRYKLAILRKRQPEKDIEEATMLRWMVKVFVVLMSIYSFFAITDFIAFNFYTINLYELDSFAYAGDFVFAVMSLWLGYHGLKQLSPRFHLGTHAKKYWKQFNSLVRL